jgi:hypothetical protein
MIIVCDMDVSLVDLAVWSRSTTQRTWWLGEAVVKVLVASLPDAIAWFGCGTSVESPV